MQRGPPDSPYAGGEYHGQLLFPAEYPFKPPGIKVCGESVLWDRELTASFQMLTPSGRFYPDKKILMSYLRSPQPELVPLHRTHPRQSYVRGHPCRRGFRGLLLSEGELGA